MCGVRRFRRAMPVFLLLCLTGMIAHGQTGGPSPAGANPSGARLDWAEVEGARHYEVTVRDAASGRILFGDTVMDTAIEIPLGPGRYEARISAVNVFRRVFAEGDWTPFSIRLTAEIKSLAVQAEDFYAGATSAGLLVRGQGLLPDTRARLEGPVGVVSARSVTVVEEGLAVEFDTTRALPGSYDLVLENPGGLTSRITKAIQVAPRMAPEITGFNRLRLPNDRVHQDLQLMGSGLSEGTGIVFRSPAGVSIMPSRKSLEPGGLLRFSLNLAEAPGGLYLLELVNPGGLKASLAKALYVVDVLAGESLADETPAGAAVTTQVPETGFERIPPIEPGKFSGKELLVEPGAGFGVEPVSIVVPETLPETVREAVLEAAPETAPEATAEATPEATPGTVAVAGTGLEVENQMYDEDEAGLPESAGWMDPSAPPSTSTGKQNLSRRLWLGVAYRPGSIVYHDTGADFGLSYLGASLAAGLSLKGLNPESWFFRVLSTELHLDGFSFDGSVDGGAGGSLAIASLGITTQTALSWNPLELLSLSLRAGYGLALSRIEREGTEGSVTAISQDLVLVAGGSVRFMPGRWFMDAGADWQGVFYVGAFVNALRPYARFGLWLD